MKKLVLFLAIAFSINASAQNVSESAFLDSIRSQNTTHTFTTFSNTNFFTTFLSLYDYFVGINFKKADSLVIQKGQKFTSEVIYQFEGIDSTLSNEKVYLKFICSKFDPLKEPAFAKLDTLILKGSSKLLAISMSYFPMITNNVLKRNWGSGNTFFQNIYQDRLSLTYNASKDLTTIVITNNRKKMWK